MKITLKADLYLDKMGLAKCCAGETCELCRVDSFDEFIERIKGGGLKGMDWTPLK